MSEYKLHPNIAIYRGQEQNIVFIQRVEQSTRPEQIYYRLRYSHKVDKLYVLFYVWQGTQWSKTPIEKKFLPTDFLLRPELSLDIFKPRKLDLYYRQRNTIFRLQEAELAGKRTVLWGYSLCYHPSRWSASTSYCEWKEIEPVSYASLTEKQQIAIIEANLRMD